jgi:hypothetical protein
LEFFQINKFVFVDSTNVNGTEAESLDETSVVTWLNTNASPSYRNYVNNMACPLNQASPAYSFCVQDTVLSQSPLLGQLTVKSVTDYSVAVHFLSNINYL